MLKKTVHSLTKCEKKFEKKFGCTCEEEHLLRMDHRWLLIKLLLVVERNM